MGDRGSEPTTTAKACAAIWFGHHGSLLEAAIEHHVIYHVSRTDALINGLHVNLAHCVIVDTAFAGQNYGPLINMLRMRWPEVSIVALADDDQAVGPVDYRLSYDSPVDELHTLLSGIAAHERPDYAALSELTRHLEELITGTMTRDGAVVSDAILRDLREAARAVVDADDVAVLLADPDYSALRDLLNLGAPGDYLAVCGEHFQALSSTERLDYLGEEALLRERPPAPPAKTPLYREAEAAEAQSYMRLPITIEERLVGFVGLFSQTPAQFDGAHLQLGRLFAAHVATAIRHQELGLRLNLAQRYQRAVSEIARVLAESLSLDEVLARIVSEAVELVAGQHGVILLCQPDRSLRVSAVHESALDAIGLVMPPGEGQAGWIVQTGQPSLISDYRHWPQAVGERGDKFPPDCDLLGVPLIYHQEVLGVLQVVRPIDAPGMAQEALEGLMSLASQAAVAVAKAQLYQTIQQDRRRLQAILDHTLAAVMVTDASGVIQLINPEAERLLNAVHFSAADVKGRAMRDVLLEVAPEAMVSVLDIPCTIEVLMGPLGEYVVHIAPISGPEGHIDGYVGVAQDVTQMRRMDRMRSNLNRVLTHDLGNMLMLARNPLELIDDPEIPPVQRDQLKGMLINSMARMETLLRDVMDLDLLPAIDQHTVIPYDLEALAQQAIDRNQDFARRSKITLHYHAETPLPQPLKGHQVLIMQAIDNLVSNAIKYTPAGGHVTICTGTEGDQAFVRVSDNGYGIPANKLTAIFEPFVRIKDEHTANIPGTGLGLNLVKVFVEAHGGQVVVESALNAGSTFSIYLPFEIAEAAQDSASALARVDLSLLVNGGRK